jgi:hypothetical protein
MQKRRCGDVDLREFLEYGVPVIAVLHQLVD